MTPINLFYLTDVTYGGFATYTAHLVLALKAQGYLPSLYKVGKRSERQLRHLTHGVPYRNVEPQECLSIAQSAPTLIVCAYRKKYGPALDALLKAGAGIVLHDPTEFDGMTLALCKKYATPIVMNRKAARDTLGEKLSGLNATVIRHPYIRGPSGPSLIRDLHAASVARIDWDKHTQLIAEANELLDPTLRVQMYGSCNSQYAFHKLPKGWDANYRGKFPRTPDAALNICASAKFLVDMSVIKGDGDGSQYTFLEAWDAGCHLVVNRRWCLTGTDAVRDAETATAVGTGSELYYALSQEPDPRVIATGTEELAHHHHSKVIPQYAAFLGWT